MVSVHAYLRATGSAKLEGDSGRYCAGACRAYQKAARIELATIPGLMPDTSDTRPSVHDSLHRVTELLRKHEVVESLVHRQQGPRQELVEDLVHRMHLVELRKQLEMMHPADVAYVLEALPLEQRLITWDLIKPEREGEILLEVSDAVRETLIAHMDQRQLVAATERLDTDEIADLAPDLPSEVIQDVFRSLAPEEREQLRAAMSYPEGTVGALMDFDMISIRDDVTVEVVLRYLRRLEEMPDHTDQLFVVDRAGRLKGLLPVNRLLVTEPGTPVATVMQPDFFKLHPQEKAQGASGAFERYDLVSAPVVDDGDRLIGRVT